MFIPDSVRLRVPTNDERVCKFIEGEVCFYEVILISMLMFLVHLVIHNLLSFLNIFLAQLTPSS